MKLLNSTTENISYFIAIHDFVFLICCEFCNVPGNVALSSTRQITSCSALNSEICFVICDSIKLSIFELK